MPKAKKIDIKQLTKLIRGAKNILVATHENPDGDGIGSMIALGFGLATLKKKVTLYMKDPVPKIYRFLKGSAKITNSLPKGKKFDLTFIIDLGEIQRVGDEFVDFPGRGTTISLDHHIKGDHNADLNFCLPKQAASGEVIFKVLKALKVKINNAMATGMFTAMVTDTGSFKYSNTTGETFAIAAELMQQGVDVWNVALNCYETFSRARMEIFKRVMAKIVVHDSGKIAWITLLKKDFEETGASSEDSEGFISYPRAVEGVEVAISYKEIGDKKYKASLRSKLYVDVAEIAENFGGGGHIRASGCKLNGSLEEVQQQMMSAILPKIN